MLYHLKILDKGEDYEEKVVHTLSDIIIFFKKKCYQEDVTLDPYILRENFRYVQSFTNFTFYVYAQRDDGSYLSLDLEHIQDALENESKENEYKNLINSDVSKDDPIIYEFRTLLQGGQEYIGVHTTVLSVFQKISEITQFKNSFRQGYVDSLYKTGTGMEFSNLTARLDTHAGSIRLSLRDAERALISNHNALQLTLDLKKSIQTHKL
jgi:hypothetical protein